MHVLVGQSRRLDDGEEAVDLEQAPADVVFLSAADTELAGLAAAHAQHDGYSLRLPVFWLCRTRIPLIFMWSRPFRPPSLWWCAFWAALNTGVTALSGWKRLPVPRG